MAVVNVCNVLVLDNPSRSNNPFQFEITFECSNNLPDDLEWKLIYVGSASDENYDQLLDSVLVGPVPAGKHMFVFQAEPPDPRKLPVDDVVGVTVILLTCSYHNHEFIRIGYFVNNEYIEEELRENPPSSPIFEKLQRNILDTNPRITRFKIDWDDITNDNNNTEAMETC